MFQFDPNRSEVDKIRLIWSWVQQKINFRAVHRHFPIRVSSSKHSSSVSVWFFSRSNKGSLAARTLLCCMKEQTNSLHLPTLRMLVVTSPAKRPKPTVCPSLTAFIITDCRVVIGNEGREMQQTSQAIHETGDIELHGRAFAPLQCHCKWSKWCICWRLKSASDLLGATRPIHVRDNEKHLSLLICF